MSWTRYLLHDFFTAREFNERDSRNRRQSRLARQRARRADDRIDDLEEDIGQVALVARTVVEVMLRKGMIERADFDTILAEVDRLDGVEDGRLAPGDAVPPPDLPPAD